MKNETWNNIEIFIRNILRTVNHKLDKESTDTIEHYLTHNEYEMAFEIMFIEIMKFKEMPEIDLIKSREIAQLLKLDEETIFDFDFWKKFEDLVNSDSA